MNADLRKISGKFTQRLRIPMQSIATYELVIEIRRTMHRGAYAERYDIRLGRNLRKDVAVAPLHIAWRDSSIDRKLVDR